MLELLNVLVEKERYIDLKHDIGKICTGINIRREVDLEGSKIEEGRSMTTAEKVEDGRGSLVGQRRMNDRERKYRSGFDFDLTLSGLLLSLILAIV